VLSHQTRHARLSAAQRRLTGRFTQDSVAAVGEATAGFGVSKPAISKHLRVLEDSGVVRRVVEGRTHRLSLEPDVLSVAADWMDRQRALWGRLFDVVDEYLKEEAPQ
jgi:DNA-binding transcriptional ArsR family regulator